MSTSPTSGRKRDLTETGGYVSNANPEEGWKDAPGTARVRLMESSSTDMLESVRLVTFLLDFSMLTVIRSGIGIKSCCTT